MIFRTSEGMSLYKYFVFYGYDNKKKNRKNIIGITPPLWDMLRTLPYSYVVYIWERSPYFTVAVNLLPDLIVGVKNLMIQPHNLEILQIQP